MRQSFSQFLRASETDSGHRGATLQGTPVNSFADLVESGMSPVAPRRNPQYDRVFNEARRLYDRVLTGDKWAAFRFQEAMTMSDFPTYFGDILDRSILANYAETPYSWDAYCKRANIQDFRQAHIFRFDRGASVLDGPIVPNSYGASGSGPTGLSQVTEYPMRHRVESQYVDQLYKFGARMDFAWEVMVNDDLDALRDTPALFGRASRRTEEKRATELYVSSTGPNATFFSNANKNLVNTTVLPDLTTRFGLTSNPPLSVTALQAALTIAAQQLDLDGEPISIEMMTLVVCPSDDVVARSIVNATQIWMNDLGGTSIASTGGSAQRLITENWARGRVRPVVNYYLPIVDTTHGNTAWYLFVDPSKGRPALQQSFLRSQPMPQMFMKSPNAVVIGEGGMGPGNAGATGGVMANPMDGDFDTDAIMYKIRHCLGGTLLDPICAVASNGSGS